MYFELDTFVLDAAQALCVALPAAGLPAFLLRLTGRGWALVAPVSVALSVAAIGVATASADVLTWIALLLVPPGCALALGWAAHGARPWLALAIVPLLAAALAAPDDPLGRAARLAMIVGSCVTLGRLLAGGTPLRWLKAGVVAMAVIDAVFIFGDFFGDQNATFNAAAPAAGLPRLQVADVGDVSTDYGDYFVAGLVGGDLRRRAAPPGARGAGDARRRGGLQPALPRGRLAAGNGAGRVRAARVRGMGPPTRRAARRWRARPRRPRAPRPAGGPPTVGRGPACPREPTRPSRR